MATAISVDGVSKTFRLYHERNQSLKARGHARAPGAVRGVPGARRRLVRDPGGRDLRAHRRERLAARARCSSASPGSCDPDAGRDPHRRARSPRCSSSAPASTPSCRAGRTSTSTARSSGCRSKQLDARFDDIVDFAGLEQFIDTPVKNYSSGMYVRLGFSVAINVDPDILLVDEVLAVGDEEFQRKCSEKFAELKHSGKTDRRRLPRPRLDAQRCATRSRCSSTASCVAVGPAGEVIDELPRRGARRPGRGRRDGSRWGSGEGKIERVELLDADGAAATDDAHGRPGDDPSPLRDRASRSASRCSASRSRRSRACTVTGPNTREAGARARTQLERHRARRPARSTG